MKKQFFVTFFAVIVAIAVYSGWSNFANHHILVSSQGTGMGGSFVINKVWSPISGPSDDYALYVIPSVAITDGIGWDRVKGTDSDVWSGTQFTGVDESDHAGLADGKTGKTYTYIAICAPTGLKTYAEVSAYGWHEQGVVHKGPAHNNMGYNFVDMDKHLYYDMLSCGK